MTNRTATGCSLLVALAAPAGLTAVAAARAQPIDRAKVLKVQAAYLYNFTKFIDWPAGAFEHEESPFVICVLGSDPFGKRLDNTVRAKKVDNRPVRIQRLQPRRPLDRASLRRCHILYISKSERRRLKEILDAVEGQPVLLVADISGFAGNDGMIGFVLAERRIVFEINREALERARLKASAKLLNLARIVKSKDRRPGGVRAAHGKPG